MQKSTTSVCPQENNKSPNRNKFVTPKSPSRKSKSKLAKTSNLSSKGNTNYDELNEKNREDSSMPVTETITSASDLITGSSTGSIPLSPECVTKLQKQSAEGLMSLLVQLGAAYQALAHYECRTAVQRLRALPHNHYNTGWALCMEGKAYYELAEYQEAVRAFEECRRLEPARLQGMDIHSTALWYLEREVSLSLLSQELLLIDRLAVETWCVAGNCFSQQKEHDTAIKFFQRAIQVNPDFAYAYSLLGHEYVQTEELDKAMSCFRAALRLDQRLYNAWLGIGSIFHKQERYPLAEVHFKRALAINPNSSVIMCYMAVTLASLHKTEKALQLLNSAISVQPKNPVCRFNRARILFSSERYQEALEELEELKEIVPRESQVYFLAGKVSVMVHSKCGC
ncbi:hypothetical protein B566_EDAN012940 [Ephemera danica]|nr:hypothetical protein B566_EDAN012940 [Ephemera danica]